MNTPTKITISRIALIIAMVIMLFVFSLIPDFNAAIVPGTNINWIYLGVCVFFLIASFTDFLDGYLARKNNQVTSLGKFLDPVADKLLVNSIMIFLLIQPSYVGNDQIKTTLWCVILLVARDIVVDAMRFCAASKGVVVAANLFGKIKTVMEMITIVFILLNGFPFSFISFEVGKIICLVLECLTTFVSLLSGTIYVIQNKEAFSDENGK